MARLQLAGLTKTYGDFRAVAGVDLDIAQGELVVLLGPSGCGKTTTLRMIAGFIAPTAGEIRLGGQDITRQPPWKRNTGLVFQSYALFPHLTVADNVAFGLRMRKVAPPEIAARLSEVLRLVRLEGLADRLPRELSGGQQQRVALARALAPRPATVLLDEPFASLDVALRERLVGELRTLLKSLGTTALVVTHDQKDAFALADQVGLMRDGRLEQWSTPYDLYHRPVSRFAAEFVGQASFVPACCEGTGLLQTELGPLREGQWQAACEGTVDVLLRPDDVVHDDASPLKAKIVGRVFRGSEFLYTLELGSGRRVLSVVPSHHDHRVGEMIGIRLDTDHVVTFAPLGEPGR
jgi:iron(III) transport system ATP-binding protein